MAEQEVEVSMTPNEKWLTLFVFHHAYFRFKTLESTSKHLERVGMGVICRLCPVP